MSLTDDWKAGKLQEGWYYVRNAFLENGAIGKLESKDNCLYCPHSYVFTNNSDTKIIAPVPSYEEVQQLKALAENGQSAIDTNQRLSKKIESLRELLKECETCVELSGININPQKDYAKDLLTRINAAIGESEEK